MSLFIVKGALPGMLLWGVSVRSVIFLWYEAQKRLYLPLLSR
jgi:hypothetical protein